MATPTSRSKIKPGVNNGQHEYWGFTQFITEWKKMDITDPAVTYYVYQLEQCPTTGRFHWQGYIELAKDARMTTVLKYLNSKDAEVYYRKGTQAEMIAYCTKTGDEPQFKGKGGRVKHPEAGPYTQGTPKTCEQGKRSDLDALCDIIVQGGSTHDVMRQHHAAYMRFSRHIDKFYSEWYSQDCFKRTFTGSESCDVTVLVGEGGTGKSKELYEIAGSEPFYEKDPTHKWWDGYKGENTVVINDYRGAFLLESLLRLLDRYQYQGEVKNGTINIRAKRFIISTNMEPETWYPGLDFNSMIGVLRRISTLIHITVDKRLVSHPKKYYDDRFINTPKQTVEVQFVPPQRPTVSGVKTANGSVIPNGVTIPKACQGALLDFD